MSVTTRTITIAIASGMLASSASAGLSAYSDQAAWEADLMSMGFTPITETFDGVEIPDMQPNGPFVVNDDLSITVEGMPDTAEPPISAAARSRASSSPTRATPPTSTPSTPP